MRYSKLGLLCSLTRDIAAPYKTLHYMESEKRCQN